MTRGPAHYGGLRSFPKRTAVPCVSHVPDGLGCVVSNTRTSEYTPAVIRGPDHLKDSPHSTRQGQGGQQLAPRAAPPVRAGPFTSLT